jgi:hypothetical protein
VRRLHARVLTLAMVSLVAAGAFALGAGTAWAHKETPILECVFHDTGTGQYNSLWGYTNSSGSTETIPIGSENQFSPTPTNRGQPTSFLSGTHHNMFVVTWNGTSSLTWSLNGHDVPATKSSSACASNPVPIAGGGPWYLLPLAFLAIGIAGVGFCCWRFDLDLGLGRSRHATDETASYDDESRSARGAISRS